MARVSTTSTNFGVFVGHHAAGRFENRLRGEVFGRDQFELVALAAQLVLNRLRDFRVALRQVRKFKVHGMGSFGFEYSIEVQTTHFILAAHP